MSPPPSSIGLAGPNTAAGLRARRERRPIADAVAHVPQTLRALVRADEIWLVVLSAFVGLGAGLVVVAMETFAQAMHRALYNLGPGEFLSAMPAIEPLRALLVPSLGGLVLGGAGWVLTRLRVPGGPRARPAS